MRILFLSSVYPQPDDHARGIYCRNLLAALSAPHEVRVIAPWAWHSRLRHAFRQGVAWQRQSASVAHPTFYYPPRILRNTHGWFMWASTRSAVNKMLNEFHPDCVLSYWTYPDGEAALKVARSLNVPMALIVGGSDVLLMPGRGRSRERFLEVLRGASAVMPTSLDLASRITDLGVDASKVQVVSRGVDRSLFFPGDRVESRRRVGLSYEGPVFLWVGRMVPVKGLDILIQACSELRRRSVDFRVCLIGDGPDRRGLETQVVNAGLSNFVRFVGPVLHVDLPDWYRAADRTVLPSRSEGVPNVLRESLACGTPFVASRVGGVPELPHEPFSRLVEAGNAAELADALGEATAVDSRSNIYPTYPVESWIEASLPLIAVLEKLVASAKLNPRTTAPYNTRSLEVSRGIESGSEMPGPRTNQV